MKSQYQTRFGEEGNCFAACIASLLECDINEVPFWKTKTDSWDEYQSILNSYLQQNHCILMYCDDYHTEYDQYIEELKGSFYILSGDSSRGFEHAVIYRDGELVHDPHPEGDGLLNVKHIYFFYKLFY